MDAFTPCCYKELIMKSGVCIVTCDRPLYLDDCIASLCGDYDELVVVDNGQNEKKEARAVADKHKAGYINGRETNSPHGQNLGLDFLSKRGCDVVLKSDDDLLYEPDYLPKLLAVFDSQDNAGAVCGTCWDKTHDEFISRTHDLFFSDIGKQVPRNKHECIVMFRTEADEVIGMRHLYGAFLYDVKTAIELGRRTKAKRGGVFGEYYSKVAYREETEFTFLLRAYMGKNLFYRTGARCYHYAAPGGIRPHVKSVKGKVGLDEQNARDVFDTLKVQWRLDPMQTGEIYA